MGMAAPSQVLRTSGTLPAQIEPSGALSSAGAVFAEAFENLRESGTDSPSSGNRLPPHSERETGSERQVSGYESLTSDDQIGAIEASSTTDDSSAASAIKGIEVQWDSVVSVEHTRDAEMISTQPPHSLLIGELSPLIKPVLVDTDLPDSSMRSLASHEPFIDSVETGERTESPAPVRGFATTPTHPEIDPSKAGSVLTNIPQTRSLDASRLEVLKTSPSDGSSPKVDVGLGSRGLHQSGAMGLEPGMAQRLAEDTKPAQAQRATGERLQSEAAVLGNRATIAELDADAVRQLAANSARRVPTSLSSNGPASVLSAQQAVMPTVAKSEVVAGVANIVANGVANAGDTRTIATSLETEARPSRELHAPRPAMSTPLTESEQRRPIVPQATVNGYEAVNRSQGSSASGAASAVVQQQVTAVEREGVLQSSIRAASDPASSYIVRAVVPAAHPSLDSVSVARMEPRVASGSVSMTGALSRIQSMRGFSSLQPEAPSSAPSDKALAETAAASSVSPGSHTLQTSSSLTVAGTPALSSAALSEAQLPAGLMQRLAQAVAQGQKSFRIALSPATLGNLDVSIDVRNEQTTVVAVTSSQVARDALEASMPRLRALLEGSDLQLDSFTITQDQSEHSQGFHSGERESGSAGQHSESNAEVSSSENAHVEHASRAPDGVDLFA